MLDHSQIKSGRLDKCTNRREYPLILEIGNSTCQEASLPVLTGTERFNSFCGQSLAIMVMEPKEEPTVVKLQPQDEDASELRFGPEFEPSKAQPLFLSEAAHLLSVKLQGQQTGTHQPDVNPVLKKSVDYAKKFDSIRGTEQAVDVRTQLESVKPPLHPFEVAQLASLVPKDAEEAKAIIPSLAANYENETLNEILKNIDTFVR